MVDAAVDDQLAQTSVSNLVEAGLLDVAGAVDGADLGLVQRLHVRRRHRPLAPAGERIERDAALGRPAPVGGKVGVARPALAAEDQVDDSFGRVARGRRAGGRGGHSGLQKKRPAGVAGL